MQHTEPASSAQPFVGDRHAWPSSPRGGQAFTPYGVSLQPGELLTQTWRVWRGDAWRLTGVTALPYGLALVAAIVFVAALVSMVDVSALDQLSLSGPLLGLLVGGGGGLMITAGLLFIAATAGIYHATEECLRQEKRTEGVMGTLLLGLSSLFRIIVAYCVMGAILSIVVAPAVGVGTWAVSSESWALGAAAVVLGCVSAVVGIFISMRFLLAGPVIVAEDVGAFAGLQRSYELTRGRFIDLFVAVLAMGAVVFGVNVVTSAIVIVPVVGLIGQLVISVILASMQSVFMFLVYAGARDLEG
jgi:hypothetical protein